MALTPVMAELQGQRVVLASGSPRRQDILRNAGLLFEVVPSRFRETLDKSSFADPAAYAVDTARHKALEVAHRMQQEEQRSPDLVIAADTIVTVDGLILEKPADEQDAFQMLSRLSGKEHRVITGVALLRARSEGEAMRTFHEETRVTFSELSPGMMWDYVRSGEPMDKAGGYGIQGRGSMLVERVSGDFLNAVGFPLNRFCRELPRLLQGDGHHGDDPLATPVPAGLLQMADGFKASRVLLWACRAKLFDGCGPRTSAQVASELGASEAATRRLLEACAALGLLHRTHGGYRPTALSRTYLTSQGAFSLRDYVLRAACTCAPDAATRRTDGSHDPDADGDAEPLPVTTAAMHGLRRLLAPGAVAAFDLSSFASACQLGGCACSLAAELAQRYPRMAVTVFLCPEDERVMPCAQDHGGHVDMGVRVLHGNMAEDVLPTAELYALWGIPDDDGDDAVGHLLGKMADAGARGVLLAEAPCGAACAGCRRPPHGLRRALGQLTDAGDWQMARGWQECDGDSLRALLRAAGFREVCEADGDEGGGHVLLAMCPGPEPGQEVTSQEAAH